MKTQKQQGDVLLRRVDALPINSKQVDRQNGRIIVMHGENGHTHAIDDVDAMLYEKDGKFYLHATKPVKIVHEEHHTQTIEQGIWEIGQVKEYDYFQEMGRTVRD